MSKPKTVKEALESDLDALARARDELRVQVQLAKAEARDEWRSLEQSWLRVEDEVKRVREHSKEPAKEMSAAAHSLMDELKRGYARIKSELKDVTAD